MHLTPMKPAKLDLEKASHKQRLDEWFEDPNYVAEPKLDGCHYFNNAGKILSPQISRKTNEPVDKTNNFPHLVEGFLKANLGEAILDGEIYYPHEHKSYGATKITGCGAEEAVRRQQEQGWISFGVFDILRDPKGNWLYGTPWRKRRELLEQIMQRLTKEEPCYHLVPVKRNRKRKFFEDVLKQGGEGVVLKYVNGLYIPGKRPMGNWIKLKTTMTDDVVILSFDPPEREYTGKAPENWPYWENGTPVTKNYYHGLIGSIAFGKYTKDGEMVYLGSCTGISDSMRKEFTENQDEYVGSVMEIKAMELTEDGKYRHPNFVRLHPDKNPHECVIEQEQELTKEAQGV